MRVSSQGEPVDGVDPELVDAFRAAAAGADVTVEPDALGPAGAGMLLVLVSAASMLRRAPKVALLGACGASLTVGVGLGIGTEGDLMGFPRIGWFHLGLALGTVGLAGALRIPASPSA